jgi:hypothetical protein
MLVNVRNKVYFSTVKLSISILNFYLNARKKTTSFLASIICYFIPNIVADSEHVGNTLRIPFRFADRYYEVFLPYSRINAMKNIDVEYYCVFGDEYKRMSHLPGLKMFVSAQDLKCDKIIKISSTEEQEFSGVEVPS